ncbi:MAG: YfhO family protein [Acidobacteria bacterium]|nr:YfhO family protein [Acidobacteriota bacterium]
MHVRSALVLAVLVAGFYWKLIATNEFVWFDHSDVCYLELPRMEFQAREFHRGRFPLWDPHIWMGQPLIGQTQPGPLHPLNIAFLLLPLTPEGHLRFDFLNYYYVFLHWIGAWGTYVLCRGLRRSCSASVVAGCVFSLAGFTGSAPWVDVLLGAIWVPWVCHFFLTALRTGLMTPAAWAGLFAGSMWLSGHHELPVMTLVAMAFACLWSRAWRTAFVVFPIAGLVSAAQLWPTIEFGKLAKRWGPANGPVGWNDTIAYLSSATYSLTPRGLIGLVFPGQGTNADSSLFAGIVAMSLVVVAVWSLWRLAPIRWFSALAVCSAVFSLGAFTPVHGWLYALIPLLSKARVPSRASVFVHLAVAVLAAYGADQVLRGRARVPLRYAGRVAAALGAMAVLATVLFKVEMSNEMLLTALAGLSFPLLAGRYPHWLFFLMFVEWTPVFTGGWQSKYAEGAHRFAKSLRKHADIADRLGRESSAVRIRIHDADVPVNYGDLYGVDMQEGYAAAATENLLHYPRHTAWAQRLYAVTHYMAKAPDLPDTMEIAFPGSEDGVNLYRLKGPLPRARIVHRVETVAASNLLEGRLSDPSFDMERTVLFVNETAQVEECEPGTVDIASYAPNRIRLKAVMRCRGVVVLADTHFPGWHAYVDGVETPVLAAYGGLRGIVAGPGQHEIDFRYKPLSVYGGGALTLLGVALTLVIVAMERRLLAGSRSASSAA